VVCCGSTRSVVVSELGGPSEDIERYATWETCDNSTGE
jgi:hypothetical protein